MTTVITAKLSLAVRLLDTTTGREVTEPDIHFSVDGNTVIPLRKDEGMYVFVNMGKEDFLMHIDVRGYDSIDEQVIRNELDPKLPIMDIFLMPSEKNRIGGEVLTATGTLSELEYIEGIYLNHPIALFHSALDKKEIHKINLLSMTAGGGVNLDKLRYALLDEDGQRYDTFNTLEQDTPTSVMIDGPLTREHKLNDKIYRIIYGRAGPDGKFVLKVRDEAGELPYLIHFGVSGKEYFRKLDFHQETGEIDLLNGAALVEEKDQTESIEEREERQDE